MSYDGNLSKVCSACRKVLATEICPGCRTGSMRRTSAAIPKSAFRVYFRRCTHCEREDRKL